MFVFDIIGVILVIQGFGSLVQEASGKDTKNSFFIVNEFPQFQPFGSIVLGVVGILLLWGTYSIRKARKPRG